MTVLMFMNKFVLNELTQQKLEPVPGQGCKVIVAITLMKVHANFNGHLSFGVVIAAAAAKIQTLYIGVKNYVGLSSPAFDGCLNLILYYFQGN
jgi:hypothetical protein